MRLLRARPQGEKGYLEAQAQIQMKIRFLCYGFYWFFFPLSCIKVQFGLINPITKYSKKMVPLTWMMPT